MAIAPRATCYGVDYAGGSRVKAMGTFATKTTERVTLFFRYQCWRKFLNRVKIQLPLVNLYWKTPDAEIVIMGPELEATFALVFLLTLSLMLIVPCDSRCGSGAFRITPNQTMVTEPFGTLVQLSCEHGGGPQPTWRINIRDDEDIQLSSNDLSPLLQFNITAIQTSNSTQLNITGAQVNSGSTFTCRVFVNSERCDSEQVITTTFFGSPSAPENVSAAVVGVGVLNVSWSFKAMPGIEVDFTLTAMNLNNVEESMILMTQDLFEIVTSPDNMSCDAYQFRVTARNAAGNTSSGYISSTFLSQPVSPREDSIQHLLEKIAGGISLHVMINDTMPCPVLNYTLFVKDSMEEDSGRNETSLATGGTVNTSISGLREDTLYSYHVIATNQFGDSGPSIPVRIVTTDVQDVTICQVNRTSFTVSCVFLDGSNDNCEYALTGMDSITGAIDSSNSEGETVVIDNIDGRQLQAHDSDLMLLGDDSGLIVTRNITGGSVEPCSVSTTATTTTTTPSAATTSPPLIGVILGIIFGVIISLTAVVLIVVVSILVVAHYKKGSRGTFLVQKGHGNHSDGSGKNKGALMFKHSSNLVMDIEQPAPLDSSKPPTSNETSNFNATTAENTVEPPSPNNPDTAAVAALASGHYEMGPDAGEVGLEPGMYDRIGSRTGKEREAHPMSQLQGDETYSKLGQEPLYSSPADAVSSTPTATKKHPKQVSSKRGSKPTAIAPAPQQQQQLQEVDLDHSTKERASKAATGSGDSVDDSVIEDAYSIPWRGNKSLHKQQSKDGQQSRRTDSGHQQNKEEGDHVDQSTTESQEQHIYQELEKTVEKKKKKKTKKSPDLVVRIISDPDPREPPPIPPFCPAGGDSPGKKTDPLPASPELPLPAGEYAEITSRGVSL